MQFLYNISILFYILGIRIASLLNSKAKLWIKGRNNIFQTLKTATENHNNIVWFHCASLGEFEQGKPIIEAYKVKYPQQAEKIMRKAMQKRTTNNLDYLSILENMFSKINSRIVEIKNNNDWYNDIEIKALKNNISIEDQLFEDALFLL